MSVGEVSVNQRVGIAFGRSSGDLIVKPTIPMITAIVATNHGSNFMAEHFQKQVRFWGIAPSYAFVGEPETNGVIERLLRTLKEQIVHGRVFQTIDEVRDAVREFVARYNAEWLIEKNGYLSPIDARAAWLDTSFGRAA